MTHNDIKDIIEVLVLYRERPKSAYIISMMEISFFFLKFEMQIN